MGTEEVYENIKHVDGCHNLGARYGTVTVVWCGVVLGLGYSHSPAPFTATLALTLALLP